MVRLVRRLVKIHGTHVRILAQHQRSLEFRTPLKYPLRSVTARAHQRTSGLQKLPIYPKKDISSEGKALPIFRLLDIDLSSPLKNVLTHMGNYEPATPQGRLMGL